MISSLNNDKWKMQNLIKRRAAVSARLTDIKIELKNCNKAIKKQFVKKMQIASERLKVIEEEILLCKERQKIHKEKNRLYVARYYNNHYVDKYCKRCGKIKVKKAGSNCEKCKKYFRDRHYYIYNLGLAAESKKKKEIAK